MSNTRTLFHLAGATLLACGTLAGCSRQTPSPPPVAKASPPAKPATPASYIAEARALFAELKSKRGAEITKTFQHISFLLAEAGADESQLDSEGKKSAAEMYRALRVEMKEAWIGTARQACAELPAGRDTAAAYQSLMLSLICADVTAKSIERDRNPIAINPDRAGKPDIALIDPHQKPEDIAKDINEKIIKGSIIELAWRLALERHQDYRGNRDRVEFCLQSLGLERGDLALEGKKPEAFRAIIEKAYQARKTERLPPRPDDMPDPAIKFENTPN